MMVTPTNLLKVLPDYKNRKILMSKNQSFDDIADLMLFAHIFFKNDYDLISKYFDRENLVETSKFLFSFLKKNLRYREEEEGEQRVSNPAGILVIGTTKGVDCKSFALFSAGILGSIIEKNFSNNKKSISLGFKFVGRERMSLKKSHVFTFLKILDQEVWIDPVPGVQFFNDRPNFDLYLKKEMVLTKNISNGIISGKWN